MFRICTGPISILSILAFLMTVDPRNKLRWSYYRCKWDKSRFSRCSWDARDISKEMHESSTTVCTATGVTDSPAQRYRRHLSTAFCWSLSGACNEKMTVDKTNINKAYQSLGILKLRNFKHLVRGPNNCKISAKSNLRITIPSLDILMPIEFSCTL